jgi:hypothetical protein
MDLNDLTPQQSALYEKFQPERVAKTLAYTGLLQLTHDVLKALVLDGVKLYYGFENGEWTVEGGESRYTREVLSLAEPRKVFEACTNWLVAQGAITDEQATALDDLKDERNAVVHELASYVMVPSREPDYYAINKALTAFFALDRYWRAWALENGRVGGIPEGGSIDADGVESGEGILIIIALQAFNVTFPPRERER